MESSHNLATPKQQTPAAPQSTPVPQTPSTPGCPRLTTLSFALAPSSPQDDTPASLPQLPAPAFRSIEDLDDDDIPLALLRHREDDPGRERDSGLDPDCVPLAYLVVPLSLPSLAVVSATGSKRGRFYDETTGGAKDYVLHNSVAGCSAKIWPTFENASPDPPIDPVSLWRSDGGQQYHVDGQAGAEQGASVSLDYAIAEKGLARSGPRRPERSETTAAPGVHSIKSFAEPLLEATSQVAPGPLRFDDTTQWSMEQREVWAFKDVNIGEVVARKIREHSITGHVLLKLTRDCMRSDLGLSVADWIILEREIQPVWTNTGLVNMMEDVDATVPPSYKL
ncbi:hypothetical protein BC830DRAFT_1082112 [Chytriomyces sp. MP71]|nr:hypothetical protein BC830DRAFT_1082112 [Chytriomyces sp. MP71]